MPAAATEGVAAAVPRPRCARMPRAAARTYGSRRCEPRGRIHQLGSAGRKPCNRSANTLGHRGADRCAGGPLGRNAAAIESSPDNRADAIVSHVWRRGQYHYSTNASKAHDASERTGMLAPSRLQSRNALRLSVAVARGYADPRQHSAISHVGPPDGERAVSVLLRGCLCTNRGPTNCSLAVSDVCWRSLTPYACRVKDASWKQHGS